VGQWAIVLHGEDDSQAADLLGTRVWGVGGG
jgi:hypothetical protein